jgi:hypothetical protein
LLAHFVVDDELGPRLLAGGGELELAVETGDTVERGADERKSCSDGAGAGDRACSAGHG